MSCFCTPLTPINNKTLLSIMPRANPTLRASIAGILIGMNLPVKVVTAKAEAEIYWERSLESDVRSYIETLTKTVMLDKARTLNLAKNTYLSRVNLFPQHTFEQFKTFIFLDDIFSSELDGLPLWAALKELYYLTGQWKGRYPCYDSKGDRLPYPVGDLYPGKTRFESSWQLAETAKKGEFAFDNMTAVETYQIASYIERFECLIHVFIKDTINERAAECYAKPELALNELHQSAVKLATEMGNTAVVDWVGLYRLIASKLKTVAKLIREGEFGKDKTPASNNVTTADADIDAPVHVSQTTGLGTMVKSDNAVAVDQSQIIVREFVEHYILPLTVPENTQRDDNGYVVLPVCHSCLMNALGAKLWIY